MKKLFCLAVMAFMVVSCNGIKKDYIVTDASYLPQPKWVKKGKYNASKKDEYKYFVSKGDNVNQRLCEKTAQARATAIVASEISNEIVDTYNNVIDSKDIDANEVASEKLEQNIKMFLAGVENEETYWEKRKYSKELGAEQDMSKYQCYALVKMNKKTYNNVLNASIDKMMTLVSTSPENKDLVKNELKEQLIENND